MKIRRPTAKANGYAAHGCGSSTPPTPFTGPPALRWLLRASPWAPAALSWGVSPGAMIGVAAIVERRWLKPGEQYVSFYWGDLALGAAAAASALALQDHPPRWPLMSTNRWAATCAATSLTAGLLTWWADARATTPTGQPVYTASQLRSPTKIWHNAVTYLPVGTVLGCVTIPAVTAIPLTARPRTHALRVLSLALLAFWTVAATWWDPRHPKPDAHIDYRWTPRRGDS